MKLFGALYFVLISLFSFSQEQITWQQVKEFPLDSNAVWHVDMIGNVYLSKHNELQKLDTTGKLMFKQSLKSLGRLSDFENINAMKSVCFSEEQQTLCFLDNTLTITDDCIDLLNYKIMNARFISVSSQPDKLWVFDQMNSRILLVSFGKTLQSQEVVNAQGVLNAQHITSIHENNNQLIMVDAKRGIFIFDLYGTLIQFIEMSGVQKAYFYQGQLLFLRENKLFMRNSDGLDVIPIPLPIEKVIDFEIVREQVFLRTSSSLIKYRVNFHEK